MAGLLADIFSYGDGLKRKVKGLLADPIETAKLGLVRFGEDQNDMINLARNAYPMAGERTVLNNPQQLKAMRKQLADKASEQAMAAATVWHGSPHKFDKFDASKIGTGEGAQAYGHGLYLAEAPDVAKTYKASNSATSDFTYSGKPITDEIKRSTAWHLEHYGGDKQSVLDYYKSSYKPEFWNSSSGKKMLKELEKMDYGKLDSGALYKVDLPDDAIAKMLDWDAPLSKQAPEVQAVLLKHPDVLDQIQKAEAQRLLLNERSPMRLEKIPSASVPYDASRMAGKDALTAIQQRSALGKTGGVEEQLRQAGIPGIRYLDGGSRGTGAGTSNFVVFPGNEGLLTILERNGQSMGGLLK